METKNVIVIGVIVVALAVVGFLFVQQSNCSTISSGGNSLSFCK